MQKKSLTYTKEDVCTLTLINDSVMITSAIDAYERRDVMKIDCPGAFLRGMASDLVLMKFRGPLVEALLLIDPVIYRDYVTTDKNGEKILYVHMSKALYGLLKSALDFYSNLRSDLEGNDFIINPFDPCVANKVVNDNDLKVSHVDKNENTKFSE